MFLHIFLFVLAINVSTGLDTIFLLPGSCGTTEPPSTGKIIKAHADVDNGISAYTTSFPPCTLVMTAIDPTERLRFSIGTGRGEVNVIDHNNGCAGAQLRLYDSNPTVILASNLCGVLPTTEYLSSADTLTLEVRSTGGQDTIINFTAAYTSFFTNANCSMNPMLFPCNNGRCVSSAGRCDVTLINNCGDFSDNSRGPPGNCSSPTTTTQIMTTTQPVVVIEPEPADLIWIAYVAGGLVGGYFLYWLLFRPGYLIWRCGFWRHLFPGKTGSGRGLCSSTKVSTDAIGKPPVNSTSNNPSSKWIDPTGNNANKPNAFANSPDTLSGLSGIKRERHIFSL